MKGNKRVLKYLIEQQNADTTLRNIYNELPIDYCKDKPDLVEYLNSKNMFITKDSQIKREKQKSSMF